MFFITFAQAWILLFLSMKFMFVLTLTNCAIYLFHFDESVMFWQVVTLFFSSMKCNVIFSKGITLMYLNEKRFAPLVKCQSHKINSVQTIILLWRWNVMILTGGTRDRTLLLVWFWFVGEMWCGTVLLQGRQSTQKAFGKLRGFDVVDEEMWTLRWSSSTTPPTLCLSRRKLKLPSRFTLRFKLGRGM